MLLLEKLEQQRKYIILVMIVCILLGVLCSLFFVPKKISSESTLMLIEKEMKSENEITNKSNLELTKKMISNFEEIIKSETTISLVNGALKTDINANKLKNEIEVKENSNSDTFKIIVKNDNSDLVVKINEELIKIFSEKINSIYANTEVYIVDNAHIEENINVILIIKVLVVSIIIGIAINAIYVIILMQIDKQVKKTSDLESELSLKNLARIPLNKSKNKLIEENSKTKFSIAFRNLRSNIQFINVNSKEKNIILITSSKKGEGKTLVSANTAIAFAGTGKKVILIDADMSSGKLAQIFNIPNDLGLSNYLSGIDGNGVEINERINKFVKDTTIKNLNIITSGTIPPNSSELLSMPKFSEVIKDLSVFYDIVILDGTPVLNETDALILARIATSTIIVSKYRRTSKEDLWHTKRDIQNIGGRIIGIIINKVRIRENQEKIYKKAKRILKETYLKVREFIITKINNRKQKLLEPAKIDEKKEEKVEIVNLLNTSNEEIKNEIKEDKSEDKKTNIVIANVDNTQSSETKDKTISEENNEKNPKLDFSETIPNNTQSNWQKILSRINIIKESLAILGKSIAEKTVSTMSNLKDVAINKIPNIKTKTETSNAVIVQEKNETANEVVDENKKEKQVDEKKEKSEEVKDENSVLVIVDAENGYCRAFSQCCFTERYVRGIDKRDGFVKANYSPILNNRKNLLLMEKYEISKKQADRVDPLIYLTLQEYDECVWIERKMSSNKAEDYVSCMSSEYEKNPGENNLDYTLRCQYLRKIELAKKQIEIEYKLENAWNSKQITFTDKIAFWKFAKAFDDLKARKKNETGKVINKPIKIFESLMKKIKVDEVKVKSVEELAKEVKTESDYENYKFEDYEKHDRMTELELEEQRIKQEQEEMIKAQIKFKKELKQQKAYEKEERRKEKNKKKLEQQKNKEMERQKAKQEARIEEELLVDNLYPKTKYNKNL